MKTVKAFNNNPEKAQSVLEYAVFIVIAALAFLGFYTRSGLQGVIQARWAQSVSPIGTEEYRRDSAPSSTVYTADVTEDSIIIAQGGGGSASDPYKAYFDNFKEIN